MGLRHLGVGAGALVVIAAVACGGGSSAKADTTVKASLKDFAVSVDRPSAPAGNIEFDISNAGPSQHEFVIFKTDFADDKLPVKDGKVDEDSSDIKSFGEVEGIDAGKSKSTTKNLPAGKYVLICNITGHYQKGIHTAFTVQ